MRALTVQQPWAWAIVHGGKDVENRTQAWGYRGPLAIHAGARWSMRGAVSPLILRAQAGGALAPEGSWDRYEARGAIIGVVDLVDVHIASQVLNHQERTSRPFCCDSPWAESSYDEHGGRRRRDVVHLVLEHPRPLEVPIPCKGRLGLWTPPAEVLAELDAAIA